jgi:hypothetical protein
VHRRRHLPRMPSRHDRRLDPEAEELPSLCDVRRSAVVVRQRLTLGRPDPPPRRPRVSAALGPDRCWTDYRRPHGVTADDGAQAVTSAPIRAHRSDVTTAAGRRGTLTAIGMSSHQPRARNRPAVAVGAADGPLTPLPRADARDGPKSPRRRPSPRPVSRIVSAACDPGGLVMSVGRFTHVT